MGAISVIAAITDVARQYMALQTISGLGIEVTSFVIGSGGSDPGDPTVALSPDPSVSTLPSQTFGPKAVVPNGIYTGVLTTPNCPQFTGLLDYTEANGAISNVGLIAEIVSSQTPNDPLIGTTYLYAIGNRPLVTKTDSDQMQINITLQT
jgi:hypothetical protein